MPMYLFIVPCLINAFFPHKCIDGDDDDTVVICCVGLKKYGIRSPECFLDVCAIGLRVKKCNI